ncbi:hypothetical protein ACFQH8_02940 [Halomicroarcula sp. GCM10025710]
MENLGDAYDGRRWEGRDRRRVVAGVALSVVGALAVVLAILIATTPLADFFGATDIRAAEKLAGTVGGLGIPAMFLGVVAVLPSSRGEQVGVAAGAGLCLAGLALFQVAYPYDWTTGPRTLAFETTILYFLGACLAFWFVFTAMASPASEQPTGHSAAGTQAQGRVEDGPRLPRGVPALRRRGPQRRRRDRTGHPGLESRLED